MNIALLNALATATAANSFVYTSTADHGPLVQAEFAQVNPAMVDANGNIATRITPKGNEYLASLNTQTQAPVTDFGAAPTQTDGFGGAAPTDFGQPAQGVQSQTQPGHGIGQQTAGNGFVRVSGFRPADKPKAVRNPTDGENEKYPFSTLAEPTLNPDGTKNYDAVFIPSSKHTKGDKAGQLRSGDDMAFSLQSACNAATRRFATIVGTEQRKDKKSGEMKTHNKYDHVRKFATQGGEQNGVVGAFIYREK